MACEADLAELRQQIERNGWQVKRPWRVVAELAALVTLTLTGVAIYWLADAWLVKAVGLLLTAYGAMGVGTNTHTASHGATSDSRTVNAALNLFGFPFFLALSASYWRFTHVVRHHPAPNVHGVDGDSDLTPWFAINERQVEGGTLRRSYYRYVQWFAFPAVLAINALQFQLSGIRYLVSQLRDPKVRKPFHWLDLACLGGHWLVWFALPMVWLPAIDVVVFTALRFALLGYAMFIVLAPGHYPAEASALAKGHGETDHFRRQCETTLNFRTGPVGRLLCAGLEFQIEHHLFPGICHVHYRAMSPAVKAFCDNNGYPHRTLGWGEAVLKSLQVFRTPKPVRDHLRNPAVTQPAESEPAESQLAAELESLPVQSAV